MNALDLKTLCETAEDFEEHGQAKPRERAAQALSVEDFYAYMPMHQYIFAPSRELWPAASVNSRVAPVMSGDKPIKASEWLDQYRAVEQMTWAPGEPMIIDGRLISNGGWIPRPGCSTFNLYLPPQISPGDARLAKRWIDHGRRV
jgi:hypothetical protein